jgi:hypothetical protein
MQACTVLLLAVGPSCTTAADGNGNRLGGVDVDPVTSVSVCAKTPPFPMCHGCVGESMIAGDRHEPYVEFDEEEEKYRSGIR